MIWSLVEWEDDETKREKLVADALAKIERALQHPLDKRAQASCHNIQGQVRCLDADPSLGEAR